MEKAPVAVYRWQGRGAGAATGAALAGVAGGLASWPEYISAPTVGLGVGAVGGVAGFAAGSWWDRRTARLQAEQEQHERWQEVFSAGPTPDLPVQTADRDPGAQLLLAESTVVDFERGHLRYVTPIRTWCVDQEPGLVWLLAGGPGAGKTRVAMRVVENLRGHTTEPWACGWLRAGPDTAQAAIAVARSWPLPVLILVDDADLRHDLAPLLNALHQVPGDRSQTVRVVLIAREFGAWWNQGRQPLRISVDTAAEHSWVGPVGADVHGQRAATRRAITAFANRLDVAVDAGRADIRGIQAGTPALLLHAAALATVYRMVDGHDAPVEIADAVAGLSDREVERRLREARRQNLTGYPQVTEEVLRDVVVLATLIGATDDIDADRLLRHVPGLTALTPELSAKLVNWLHLYGVVAGYHTRPHLPATIAEHLVAKALAGNTTLPGR